MPNVSVYKTDGKEVGTITLADTVFGVDINQSVMHDAVVAHLANKRQGTQSALTRSEVRGGGIKPFRQKGTGRARQGTIRAPQMTGGGIVFAPKPRDYSMKLNKKVKRLALCSALSQKVVDSDMIVVEDLVMGEAKTKEMIAILKNLNAKKALIVTNGKDDSVVRAAANIQGVKTTIASTLNVYDVLKYDKFIVTKEAVNAIEEVYA
ncbi:MAG: 50S ribosomal protein L4 [Christensenellaceae bacterium]